MKKFVCHFTTDCELDDFSRKERLIGLASACIMSLSKSWPADGNGLTAATFEMAPGVRPPAMNELKTMMESRAPRFGFNLHSIRLEA